MSSTGFSIADMLKQPEPGVPFTEKRDTFELYQIPYYEDTAGMAPCGAIVSNINDMSHWLIALMNNGTFEGRQVVPADVLKATLAPAIALPNTAAETRGFWEILNSAYGMGRWTASYRGHLIAYHGGDLPGFHSQVSYMPKEGIGVLVFVIGDHCAGLYNIVSYNVYERMLGMDQTPWSARQLETRLKAKTAGTEARGRAGADRVPDTKPSHPLADFAGKYEHPAYGVMTIDLKDGACVRLEQGEISGGEMRRLQVERLRFMDDVFNVELAERNARSALLALMNAPRLDIAFQPTEPLGPGPPAWIVTSGIGNQDSGGGSRESGTGPESRITDHDSRFSHHSYGTRGPAACAAC